MEERAIFLELQCAAYVPRRLLDVACRDLRALYDVCLLYTSRCV